MGRTREMGEKDYPALFAWADGVSVDAQKLALCLERGRLGLLILGSFAPIVYAMWDDAASKLLDGLVVVVLVLIIVIGLVAKVRRDDRVWFDGRAVAESAKAATWRYMMSMRPFVGVGSQALFLNRLKEIRSGRESLANSLSRQTASREPSDFMELVRDDWPFEDRRQFYLTARLKDQLKWYEQAAKKNGDWEQYTFWWFVGLQVVAVGAGVGKLVFEWHASVVPALMTAAAALIAWAEMKRYRELARSYAVTRDELREQEAAARMITDEVEFLAFIEAVEEAISREHTMWCVKRETVATHTGE